MSAERTVTVTEVVPRTLDSVTTDSLDADRWLSRRYSADDTGFTRLNMVTSVTGSIAGADGTSETITSPTDRMILRAVRANADVVVVGATTARTERYLLPAHARLAVVTATGDLDGVRLTRPGRPPALVLSSRAHRERVHARLAGAPVEHVTIDADEQLDPRAIVAELRERGLPRVVCEGGPTIATRFLEAGCLDEICLTIAPALEPSGAAFVSPSRPRDATVAGMLVDDCGFSYLRLHPRDRVGASSR
ncbi:MAG TPA: hypothetical protein DCS84_01570 [Microbacterium sp.]|nr:hypothetical protein [Microbacterium sp.]